MNTIDAILYFQARLENAKNLNLKPVTIMAEARALEALKFLHITAKEITEQHEAREKATSYNEE